MHRVLIVEDEQHLAEGLRFNLEAEGYRADVVDTGEAALERLLNAPDDGGFDLVVLDVMLPGQSGYRVLQALRGEGNWVPVLMLTAKDGEHDEADALDVGADDYFTKPFSFVVLVARLRALLRRGAPSRPVVLTVGDLSLDPASRRVERAGVPVELTTREFALLEYLMRNAGRVVSKTMILSHVWDYSFDPRTNVVDVLVFRLREKIDKGFDTKLIQTVRGIGYVLQVA